jgi:uncharacterized protein YabE (DUF348 family)
MALLKKNSSALAFMVSVPMMVLGGYDALNNDVTLKVDDKVVQMSTFSGNVEELLEEKGIKVDSTDKVLPGLDAKLEDGMEVEFKNSFKVNLTVAGLQKEITTTEDTLKDLLTKQNVSVNRRDILSHPLNHKLQPNEKIDIVKVEEKIVKETQKIPYEVKTVLDNNLYKGETRKTKSGKLGEKQIAYKVVYHNGKPVNKIVVGENVTVEPTTEIVKKGTAEIRVASSRSSVSRGSTLQATSTSGVNMRVTATAYTGGGTTATGVPARYGVIAVDPRVIPYGTRVYIPQFGGTFVAADTGGAIKGNKIDVYLNSYSECMNFGRRTLDIVVLGR